MCWAASSWPFTFWAPATQAQRNTRMVYNAWCMIFVEHLAFQFVHVDTCVWRISEIVCISYVYQPLTNLKENWYHSYPWRNAKSSGLIFSIYNSNLMKLESIFLDWNWESNTPLFSRAKNMKVHESTSRKTLLCCDHFFGGQKKVLPKHEHYGNRQPPKAGKLVFQPFGRHGSC